jgi:hypothetical protein
VQVAVTKVINKNPEDWSTVMILSVRNLGEFLGIFRSTQEVGRRANRQVSLPDSAGTEYLPYLREHV